MHRLIRALLLAATAALLAATAPSSAIAEAPRRVVWVFKYDRVTPENQSSFDQFAQIIHSKFSILAEEIQRDTDPITDISKLSTERLVDDDMNHVTNLHSNAQLNDLWDQNGALALLTGRMHEIEGQPGVRSRIFLGPLAGNLSSAFVQVDLPIATDEFDLVRDSHSTVALYALGMDTVARCGPPHEAARFFHMASSRLPQLGATIRDAEALRSAIDAALVDMRERCGGNSP